MRIQTKRTPSGVRFVFVYIFHAPRSCMIGQQGSLGSPQILICGESGACPSTFCQAALELGIEGNAREKGGFYFFFFNYYRSDVSVSFASGVLCALSPLAQFLLSLVVPHGMRVCRPSAALCASIASMFIVRHLMPVFPSFVSAAFYAAGLFFDNPITRSVDLSGSPIPA